MDRRHENGVTLIELLVTLAVMAVVAGIAIPSFTTLMQSNAMTASANEMVSAFLLARSEALKRGAPVTVCWTSGASQESMSCGKGEGWHSGWVVFEDTNADARRDASEPILRRQTGLPGRDIEVKVRADAAPLDTSLTFLPSGFPDFPTTLGGGRNMLLCDARERNESSRVINMSQTGRPQVRDWGDFENLGVSCEE
jgi:type IV fimbrial biogenesis protein FimT